MDKTIIDPSVVSIIGISLTLVVGVFNLLYSMINNKKNIFVNTVTNLRSEWLNSMKNDLSTFIALLSDYFNNSKYRDDKERNELKYKLEFILRKVQLNINPYDEYDVKLVDTMMEILRKYDTVESERVNRLLDDFIYYVQKLAKLEWEGIKKESIKGNLSKKEKITLINSYLR